MNIARHCVSREFDHDLQHEEQRAMLGGLLAKCVPFSRTFYRPGKSYRPASLVAEHFFSLLYTLFSLMPNIRAVLALLPPQWSKVW